MEDIKLYIYNRKLDNYFSKEYLKFIARLILKKFRGPQAVTQGILNGLDKVKFSYNFNSRHKFSGDEYVFINESVDALRWAIFLKKNKKIKKLIVGPNMVLRPSDYNGIISSPEIDIILLPCEWAKNCWIKSKKDLDKKIIIWPSGIELFEYKMNKKNRFLIYQKNANKELLDNIELFFQKNNIEYKLIKYGFYKHEDYLNVLDNVKGAVFLSESESQGIALCEAWSKNVATLVWNRRFMKYKDIFWSDEKISAPYLEEECGIFFKDYSDFENKWNYFINKIDLYKPREYIEKNMSLEGQTLKLINFIKEI